MDRLIGMGGTKQLVLNFVRIESGESLAAHAAFVTFGVDTLYALHEVRSLPTNWTSILESTFHSPSTCLSPLIRDYALRRKLLSVSQNKANPACKDVTTN